MQVDVLLDPFGARWPDLREAASTAVDAGFSGIWTWDHLDGRVYNATHVLECWTVLTAIAVAVLAVMASTLQDVSGGRLLLGLGAGGGPDTPYLREQEAIGRTVAADPLRRAQVETCVEEVRHLWRS